MAALQNLLPALELGKLYVSFDALKHSIEDWPVRKKFHFTVPTKDVSRVIYIHATGDLEQRSKMMICSIKISVLRSTC